MKSKGDYIVGTADRALFIRCWTEGETIIFTRKVSQAETHLTPQEAKDYASRVQDNAEIFLIENTESNLVADQEEIPKPALRAWQKLVKITLAPVD
jgi:hypothetical protein